MRLLQRRSQGRRPGQTTSRQKMYHTSITKGSEDYARSPFLYLVDKTARPSRWYNSRLQGASRQALSFNRKSPSVVNYPRNIGMVHLSKGFNSDQVPRTSDTAAGDAVCGTRPSGLDGACSRVGSASALYSGASWGGRLRRSVVGAVGGVTPVVGAELGWSTVVGTSDENPP